MSCSYQLHVSVPICPCYRMGADNPEDEEEKSTKISKDMAGNMFDQIMNDQGGI